MINITVGNVGAKILTNDDSFRALFLVNTRQGIDHANAQVVSGKTFKTEAGARRWADKMMSAHYSN